MFDYLEKILLPRDLIEYLCEADIEADSKKYLEKVSVLHEMLESTNDEGVIQSKALEEVKPELDKLKFKVCSRARNFLIAKLNNLKKPKTNFQIIQESILLKYKPLVAFLREHHVDTYVELTSIYAEIMDSIYYVQLRQYFNDTIKAIQRVKSQEGLFQDKTS